MINLKYLLLFLGMIPLLVFISMCELTFLLWLIQFAAIEITDTMKTAILTFCGALSVAAFALYGVIIQKASAEDRHRADKDLELRKNICMEVAEAYAMQQQYLLKLAIPDFKPEDLLNDTSAHTKAFFKMHMVCTEKTIKKMLDANEEWARLFLEIPIHCLKNRLNDIDKLIYIQERSLSFLEKVADFNVVAREDLKIPFEDKNEYVDIVSESYKRIPTILKNIKQG